MSVDSYAPCPCGSGKKLKFCCGADWPEIERIEKLYESGQEHAAFDALVRLEAKLPNHPHLLQLKSELLMALGRQEEAEAVCDELIAKHPDNAHSRFLATLRLARDAQLSDAIRSWYTALAETASNGLVGTAMMSGRTLAMAAFANQATVAGRMLLNVLGSIDKSDESIQRLNAAWRSDESQPLLIRELPYFIEAPADARWATAFTDALTSARGANLPKAESQFAALAEQAPNDPAVWSNLATLRAALADLPGAAQAYAKLADCSADWDDAVEAEAMSLLYRDDLAGDVVEQFAGEFELQDVDRALETLASNRRFARVPDALLPRDGEDSPPPRAVFRWLDKPEVPASATQTFADVPTVIGAIQLFGRETDRPARFLVSAFGAERFDESVAALRSTIGEPLPALGEREIAGAVLTDRLALTWSPQLSTDLTADQVYELNRGWHQNALMNAWPHAKNHFLNGATPAEAVAGPAKRRALAAAVLLLQCELDVVFTRAEFDPLRTKLGLPAPADIDPASLPPDRPVEQIPLVRLPRVEASKLSDQQVIYLLNRAAAHRMASAVAHLGEEGLRREKFTLEDHANFYAVLAQSTVNTSAAVKYLQEAQRCLVQAKQSPAYLMLFELRLRFQRREAREIDRLMKTITTRHQREPGVMQALASFLAEIGLIGPDGRPVAPPAEQPGLVIPGEEESSGKLWTPETAATTSGKSALWVPGME